MPEFKFAIGELCGVIGSLDRFQVIERFSTECSSGKQLAYLGRLYQYTDHFGIKEEASRYAIDGRQLYRLHECELVAID